MNKLFFDAILRFERLFFRCSILMKNFLLGMLMSLILSACATTHPQLISTNINSNLWSLRGKIGIQSPQTQGSAYFYWQQNKDSYHIRFFGPLGLGAESLNGNLAQVEFINHQGQVFTANSPEILLQKNLGWSVPVSPLIYWIRGMSAPLLSYHEKIIKKYNSQQQLIILKQQNWDIQYLSYQSEFSKLPKLIRMDNEKMHIKIKIFIDSWGF